MVLRIRLERSLFAVGAALCIFFVGAITYRAIGSRLAVRSFGLTNATPQAVATKTGNVGHGGVGIDFRLWSEKRVAAYRDALAKHFDPPLAVLRVEKLGIEVPVFDGTDELVLNRGVGRIIGTAHPGEPGNVGIAGHRDGFFRGLKDIAVGDSLTLDISGGTAVYVVNRIDIVDPADVSVLEPTASPSLTLVTCYPFYFIGDAPQRYIVRCTLKTGLGTRAGLPVAVPSGN